MTSPSSSCGCGRSIWEQLADLEAEARAARLAVERAEGLLRRYNLSGASRTLDADVIKWLMEVNASRGIVSNFGDEALSAIDAMNQGGQHAE